MGRGILSGLFWGSIISVFVLGAVSLLAPLPQRPGEADEELASVQPGPDTTAPSGQPVAPDEGVTPDSAAPAPGAPESATAVPDATETPEPEPVKVENDVASMFQVDGVELAPGETITLQPGQKHVMFMGLNGDPFEAGEEVPARLIFEQAGAVAVVFNVETAEG